MLQHLKHYLGYNEFRPGQQEVVEALLQGKDVLALLPTGMGKSLCYQLTGKMMQRTVLIISPLLSLMQDQVEQMKKMGIKRVIALNSFLTRMEKQQALQQLSQYEFIFTSPEMLQQGDVKERLTQLNIGLITIDEAHCISQWGYDFRPDYLRLGKWLKSQKNIPILALSATATYEVMDDIKKVLHMTSPFVYLHNMDRKELHFSRKWFNTTDEKVRWIKEHVMQTMGPGIIYTPSRRKTEEIARLLQDVHIQAAAYHAGLESHDRQLIQAQFIANELEWIVATSAFGMGVHKPNIRQVIHETMSPSLAHYMQEAGRAARDGQDAVATLLCAPGDDEIIRFLALDDLPTKNMVTDFYAGRQLELSETQLRVLTYWYSEWSYDEAIQKLKELITQKMTAIRATQDVLYTDECMRVLLMSHFGQSKQVEELCCSLCSDAVDNLIKVRKWMPLPQQMKLNWQERLDKLLN